MKKLLPREAECVSALLLGLALSIPPDAWAQDHVVSPSEIQKDVAAASAARGQDREQVRSFLSSADAQRAMKSAHIDYREVMTAVNQLSDDDLARLAARSQKTQADFAAGNMTDHDLLIILVGFAALILIIVAVH